MKHLKSFINSLLGPTEECSLCVELTKVVSKTKSKSYIAILYNKKNPYEKELLLLEPMKDKPGELEVVGLYAIGHDFGIKIISEMSFNLFFRETSHFFTFEALSVGAMWTVVSALTKACSIPQGTKLEHLSMNSYIVRFNLNDPKKTNKKYTKINDKEDELDMVTMKDQFLQKKLKEREREYVEPKKLNIVIGTWNVSQKIPHKPLNDWLQLKTLEADIYAIGLQEIDMSATAMLKEETDQGLAWDSLLINTFDSKKYEKVFSKQLVGIYNCVFIKRAHLEYLTDLRVDSVSVGVMGLLGNKGGFSIRFQLYKSTFCFTVAHLTAHKSKVEQRNHNFGEILNKSFTSCGLDYHPFKHDFLYWYGDFNYRTANLLYDEVLRLLSDKQDFAKLLEHDQLTIEKRAGRTFNGLKEDKIEFPPTYKYDFGTSVYDTSEKKRIPSYTDRIMYRVADKDAHTSFYNAIPAYTSSDHKPVVMVQEILVKQVLEDKLKRVHDEISKEVDKMENDMLPDLQIKEKDFFFGNVKIDTPVVKKLILENNGQVVSQFGLISKPGTEYQIPDWLKISQTSGILSPGQKLEIDLTINVSAEQAPPLNFGKEIIESMIVIHVRNGGDYFISLRGNWIKSCYGSSLEFLVRDKGLRIPKQMWRMVDYIYKNGLKSTGLFMENSLPAELEAVRDQLDLGENLKEFRVHTVAEALLLFLESLEESVIPREFTEKCVSACGSQTAALNVIQKFPPVHFNTFNYLMSFLREMLFHPENKLNADELAIIFSTILFKTDKMNKSLYERKSKMNFIKLFLVESMEYKIQDKKE